MNATVLKWFMASSKARSATPAPISQPALPPISAQTVALMIHLCELMFSTRPFRDPVWDITKLSTVLFGMGFGRDFLSKCESEHYWDFASLFPALHDGSFYQLGPYGRSRGQGDLRGFATFLCGNFTDAPWLRSELFEAFEQSLARDGYKFAGRRLVETLIDTNTPAALAALPNKTALQEDLSTELGRNEPVAIIFFDLDHFKEVNDRVSHAEGNECLEKVVGVTSLVLVRKGKLYRVGGDEFCAMLPNFTGPEAMAAAERIRRRIDELEPFGGIVKVTASIGVAVADGAQLTTPDALIDAADEAMYVAKFTTENRVCLWPPNRAEAEQAAEKRQKPRR
jgi:diguanylate cyclase (GGDEF)-like protein